MVGVVEYAPYSLLSQTREDEGDLCAAFVSSLFIPYSLLNVVSFNIIHDANEEYIHWMKVIKNESTLFDDSPSCSNKQPT